MTSAKASWVCAMVGVFRLEAMAVVVIGLLVGLPAVHAQEYTITAIDPLADGTVTNGRDINGSGQVVVMSDTAAAGGSRVLLWSGGTSTTLGIVAGESPDGYAINASGQIVGISVDAAALTIRGVLWSGGTLTDLGHLGGTNTYAWDLNDGGVVVGQSLPVAGAVNYRAFRWQGGVMTSLETLAGGSGGVGGGVNNLGQIVGQADTAGETHAVMWSAAGVITDLGTLGGNSGIAWAVNESGVIVGQSKTAAGLDHAFMYTTGGGMTDLGTLGGNWSVASDVNESGVVVGSAFNAGGLSRAFIYDTANGMRDLNGLIPSGTDWILTTGAAINDSGQITGTGTLAGQTRAFVLTPVSNPGPGCCLPVSALAVPMLLLVGFGLCRSRSLRGR